MKNSSLTTEPKPFFWIPEIGKPFVVILKVLEALPEITPDNGPSLLSQLEEKTGRKGKGLYAPLRAGVTGKMKGPELVKTLPLLGKERMIQRLKMALEIILKRMERWNIRSNGSMVKVKFLFVTLFHHSTIPVFDIIAFAF